MTKLSHKIALILALSSFIPLIAYGIYAVNSSYKTSFELTKARNQAIAEKISGNIEEYIDNTVRILSSLSEILGRNYLTNWQKEEILENYRMKFREFDSLDLYSFEDGRLISSIPGKKELKESEKLSLEKVKTQDLYLSDFFITDSLIPSLMVAVPIKALSETRYSLIGTLNMLSVWSLVDNLKIGKTGFPVVLSKKGEIFAYGNPFGKALIIEKVSFGNKKFLDKIAPGTTFTDIIINPLGEKVLASGREIPQRGWFVIVEQSVGEAFADSRGLLVKLSLFAACCLIAAALAGIFGGKKIVNPIKELQHGTREIAKGNLAHKIIVKGRDEIQALAQAFNQMAEDLVKYRDEIIKKERLTTFARLASGLVHDLKHPIQNIRNSYNLIMTKPKDREYFATFKTIMERELEIMQRFFNDLRDIAHPPPLTLVDLNLCSEINCISQSHAHTFLEKKIAFKTDFQNGEIRIRTDKFLFARIINNILSNSINALNGAGRITICVSFNKDAVIEITDDGPGISKEKLSSIFDEFVSLSRGGLGLGLAVVKKMVTELNGTITMESELYKGTKTTLRFPI